MKFLPWPKELILRPLVLGLWLIIIAVLIATAGYNYALFHIIAEGFAIVVAALIYVLATRTYRYSGNNFLLFLGIAFFFIAIFDFLHLITYAGIMVFPGCMQNVSTQLWITGRYIEAATLFLAPFFAGREFNSRLMYWIYALVSLLLLAAIMWLKIFPVCFIPGTGLTAFKIYSELIIILCTLLAIGQLYRITDQSSKTQNLIITIAMLIFILSELSFTLYHHVDGMMNLIGHIFKVISYYLIYLAVVQRGLNAPFDTIFKELKDSAITDRMTGLYNRQGFMELARQELNKAGTERRNVGFLMVDLDKFKRVNDRFGHQAGDLVLQKFAAILRSAIKEDHIACRLGGDEFVAIVDGEIKTVELIQRQLRQALADWTAVEPVARDLGLSIGKAIWKPGQPKDIDALIKEADQEMYREKQAKNYSR